MNRFVRREGSPPYILGHRGVRGDAPENTMAAFELAAASGADGIELDIRDCRTGELVVCHDPSLSRVSGGRDTRRVAQMTLRELAACDVGDGQPVPSLVEVLRFARDRKLRVNIEMKRDAPSPRRVVRETASLLGSLGEQQADIIVSSFDPWMLRYLALLAPRVQRGYLFANEQKWLRTGWVARVLRTEAVHPERMLVDEASHERWRRHGKLVNVWTVNDEAEARRLAALGVDAIITDRPRAIAEAVR